MTKLSQLRKPSHQLSPKGDCPRGLRSWKSIGQRHFYSQWNAPIRIDCVNSAITWSLMQSMEIITHRLLLLRFLAVQAQLSL